MRCLTLVLAFLGFVACAQAQFEVSLTLPENTYVALEAIPATVAITNRTGGDIVLGGPGRSSWLSFEMTDTTGRALAPIEVANSDMVQIPAGATVQRKIIVTDAYAPSEIGNYGLTARVLHPPTQQYYGSDRVRFSITEPKQIWDERFGVPEGFPEVGNVRRYAISVLRGLDKSRLYFRLIDEKTGLRLQTYTLGPVSMVYDPQITLDKTNRLEMLYLVMPKIFAHVVIQPDGKLLARSYYRELTGNRPRMVVAANGEITINGGEAFDPTATAPKDAPKRKGVSERPPGL